jgi:hypothetical protein
MSWYGAIRQETAAPMSCRTANPQELSSPHLVHSGATGCLEGRFTQEVNLRASTSEPVPTVRR